MRLKRFLQKRSESALVNLTRNNPRHPTPMEDERQLNTNTARNSTYFKSLLSATQRLKVA